MKKQLLVIFTTIAITQSTNISAFLGFGKKEETTAAPTPAPTGPTRWERFKGAIRFGPKEEAPLTISEPTGFRRAPGLEPPPPPAPTYPRPPRGVLPTTPPPPLSRAPVSKPLTAPPLPPKPKHQLGIPLEYKDKPLPPTPVVSPMGKPRVAGPLPQLPLTPQQQAALKKGGQITAEERRVAQQQLPMLKNELAKWISTRTRAVTQAERTQRRINENFRKTGRTTPQEKAELEAANAEVRQARDAVNRLEEQIRMIESLKYR